MITKAHALIFTQKYHDQVMAHLKARLHDYNRHTESAILFIQSYKRYKSLSAGRGVC